MAQRCDMCVERCDIGEAYLKACLDFIAERFSGLAERNKKLIQKTPENEIRKGKLDVLVRTGDFLDSMCPRDFAAKTERGLDKEIPGKVLEFLDGILEENKNSSDAYLKGMSPALKMAGGYVAAVLSMKELEMQRLS